MIVWTDIETTGLDERTGQILEVAMVVTDDELVEQRAYEIVIWQDGDPSACMDAVVLEMHTKNGLLHELEHDSKTAVRGVAFAERTLIEWLLSTPLAAVKDYRGVPLAGSTVGFDRRWLRHHMPRLEGMFSHRSIDVSSVTELAKRWGMPIYEGRPKSTERHRALVDVRGSIELLRYYRKFKFVGDASHWMGQALIEALGEPPVKP